MVLKTHTKERQHVLIYNSRNSNGLKNKELQEVLSEIYNSRNSNGLKNEN